MLKVRYNVLLFLVFVTHSILFFSVDDWRQRRSTYLFPSFFSFLSPLSCLTLSFSFSSRTFVVFLVTKSIDSLHEWETDRKKERKEDSYTQIHTHRVRKCNIRKRRKRFTVTKGEKSKTAVGSKTKHKRHMRETVFLSLHRICHKWWSSHEWIGWSEECPAEKTEERIVCFMIHEVCISLGSLSLLLLSLSPDVFRKICDMSCHSYSFPIYTSGFLLVRHQHHLSLLILIPSFILWSSCLFLTMSCVGPKREEFTRDASSSRCVPVSLFFLVSCLLFRWLNERNE